MVHGLAFSKGSAKINAVQLAIEILNAIYWVAL